MSLMPAIDKPVPSGRETMCKCGHQRWEHKGIGACRHGWSYPITGKSLATACHCGKFRRSK